MTLAQDCAAGLATIRTHEIAEDRLRKQRPLCRIWDAEWNLQHLMSNDYKSEFSWVSNDSGPGQSEIPYDSPLAAWVTDETGRIDRGEGRNIFITVDYCGARWSGCLDKWSVEQREDGDRVLVISWLHDYEKLKWYSVWSNPFLPAFFQFPRAFLLAGPVTWVLKLTLFLQIFREHNPFVTWPDDPLDPAGWFNDLDMSTWSVVVSPNSFLDAAASGVVWGVLSSRFGNFHDVAHTMLEDAELSVHCKRFLEGDADPWIGAGLRPGTLVIDILDKSGIYVGTSHGGNYFSGLIRTVVEFLDDFIDSTEQLIEDTSVPVDYFNIADRYTDPALPYVIFLGDRNNSPIESSQFINSPAKGIQVLCGGHSMPGVNEAISATVQAIGDIVGNLIQIGSLGGTIDTLIKPIYEDTILAFWAVKNFGRAQNSGWDRYFEYWQNAGEGGSSKAYTIASLMVLRAGFWATRTVVSWKVTVRDGAPFIIGDRPVGHFFLDDRIGLVILGSDEIHMDRCRKIDLAWGEDGYAEWQLSVGDDRIWQDPAVRAWSKLESLVAGLRDMGVWNLLLPIIFAASMLIGLFHDSQPVNVTASADVHCAAHFVQESVSTCAYSLDSIRGP